MRVRFSSLRCFFFAIRLRRFLITEPTVCLSSPEIVSGCVRSPAKLVRSQILTRRRRIEQLPCSGATPGSVGQLLLGHLPAAGATLLYGVEERRAYPVIVERA